VIGAPAARHGAGGRRERLRRERTASELWRDARLEQQVVEQLEPLLGPAGRPTGSAAMAAWRRRHVDAYLSLPPWRRAWRTWVSWTRLQRASAVVALTGLWTLLVLPLQLLGLAGVGASKLGVAALLALVPVAAVAPPRPRGRFIDPLPAGVGLRRWRDSPAARRAVAAGAGLVAVCAAAAVAIAALGLGPSEPSGLAAQPPPLDAAAVRQAVATACGPSDGVEVRFLRPGRYEAVLPGGATVIAQMERGRSWQAPGDQGASVVGGPAACTGS
jgi:hypothetical protein